MPPKLKGKGKGKRLPVRSLSPSTEEEDNEEEAELLVSDKKSVASKKLATSKKSKKAGSLTSPRTKAKNRSNSSSLEDPVQEDLLDAVEGKLGGGRDALAARPRGIPRLLEDLAVSGRTDLVGKSGSKQRKGAYDKIYAWLQYPDDQYSELLGHFEILPFQFRFGASEVSEANQPPVKKAASIKSKGVKKQAGKKEAAAKKPPKVIDTRTSSKAYRDTDTSILTDSDDEESTKPSTQPSKMSEQKDSDKKYPHYEKVGNLLIGEYARSRAHRSLVCFM